MRFSFFDSARHWRDQKIVADPAPRNPSLFPNSTAWNGRVAEIVAALVTAINALPADQQGAARSYAVIGIADTEAPPGHPSPELGHDPDARRSVPETDQPEGGLGAGPAGSRTTSSTFDRSKYQTDRQGRFVDLVHRDPIATASGINAANRMRHGQAVARDGGHKPMSIAEMNRNNSAFYAKLQTPAGPSSGRR